MKKSIKNLLLVLAVIAYSGWTYMVGMNAPPTMSKFDAWVTAPIGLLLYAATALVIIVSVIMYPIILIINWFNK